MIAGRSVALGTPQQRRLYGRRASGVHTAGHQAAAPPRPPAPSRPAASALRRQLVLTLNLAASALAGAAITILLWNSDTPKQPSLDALIIDRYDAASRRETIAYRIPPAELQKRQDRPVTSWDAEAEALADRPVPKTVVHEAPKTVVHEVRTMKFVAPIEHEITASVAPVARELPAPAAAPTGKAPDVKNWRYQLAGIDPQAVASSPADLVVIDYAGRNGPFTRADVEQMRRKPDGSRRLVLAYMSIGQAETYRWYWPQRSSAGSAPGQAELQRALLAGGLAEDHLQYTGKSSPGFDGVYLDHVDDSRTHGHKDDMVEIRRAHLVEGQGAARRLHGRCAERRRAHPQRKFRKAIDALRARPVLRRGRRRQAQQRQRHPRASAA